MANIFFQHSIQTGPLCYVDTIHTYFSQAAFLALPPPLPALVILLQGQVADQVARIQVLLCQYHHQHLPNLSLMVAGLACHPPPCLTLITQFG